MADLEKLLKQREALEEKIKAERVRQAEEERKRKEAAVMVFGHLLIGHTAKDWKEIDIAELDVALGEMEPLLGATATHKGRTSEEAYKAIRAFEKSAK